MYPYQAGQYAKDQGIVVSILAVEGEKTGLASVCRTPRIGIIFNNLTSRRSWDEGIVYSQNRSETNLIYTKK